MKSILIIGLGRFGRHMSRKFIEQGNEVLGVDCSEERVNDSLDIVTKAIIGDAKNPNFIEHLGVNNFDLCVVAIGDDFQSSLETTSLLKEEGAKYVLARASREVHAKFLLRNGADEIVYAEKEMAERLAVKFGNDNVFEYIELTVDYSIYEVTTPKIWIGKTIIEMNVRSKYRVNVLGTKNSEGVLNPTVAPDYVFSKDDTLVILGKNSNVDKIIKLN